MGCFIRELEAIGFDDEPESNIGRRWTMRVKSPAAVYDLCVTAEDGQVILAIIHDENPFEITEILDTETIKCYIAELRSGDWDD